MAIGLLKATGIISNVHLSTPDNEWYTTVEADEIIPFVDHYGSLSSTNEITIFANTTNLLVSLCIINDETTKAINYESDKLFIADGTNLETTGVRFNALKVHGALGQQVKYIGNRL